MAVWDTTSGQKVQTLEGQQAIVSHLALANQLVVSASLHSPYIKLWDISPKYLEQRRMTFGDRSGTLAVTTDQRFDSNPSLYSFNEKDSAKVETSSHKLFFAYHRSFWLEDSLQQLILLST